MLKHRKRVRENVRGLPLLALTFAFVAPPPVHGLDLPEGGRLIVRFEGEAPVALPEGVAPLYRFASEPAIYLEATAAGRRALELHPRVLQIEPDAPVAWALETATLATRVREVQQPTFGLTGSGIGLAIVDTGIDGTHPDLADRIDANYLVTPAGLVDAPYTVQANAHGTHVAGIAVGTGAASDGLRTGAAPGASLYGFAIMPAGTVALPAIAFDWILQHGAAQEPPIRIVSNSWGCESGACKLMNGERLHVTLARSLAQAGFVVVWAAGNSGGDGFVPTTNEEIRDPTPGILGVAAYDDDDRGLRTRCVGPYSSRGGVDDAITWPDLAAPGSRIMSAWAIGADVNTRSPVKNTYRQMSGTSMAAPHVAGITALLLEANPALGPGDVEYVLKSTARKLSCGTAYVRADPAHPYDGANHVEGHGLVDAVAAVVFARGFGGLPEPPAPEPIPDDLGAVKFGVRADEVLYVDGGGLSRDPPGERPPLVRLLAPNEAVVHEGPPLPAGRALSGIEVDVYVGTFAECPCVRFVQPTLRATVEAIATDGASRPVAVGELKLRLAPTAAPVLREFVIPLDAPVQLVAGERLRATIVLATPTSSDVYATWAYYSGSSATPSRILLGERIRALPAEPEGCQVRVDCARLGGDRNHAAPYCGIAEYRVRWEGPAGSGALVECNGSVASCAVEEPVWGSCEATAIVHAPVTGDAALCSYFTRDRKPVAGVGRCEAVVPDA